MRARDTRWMNATVCTPLVIITINIAVCYSGGTTSNAISVTNRNIKRNGKLGECGVCVCVCVRVWESDDGLEMAVGWESERAEDEKFYVWWPVNAPSRWRTKVSQQNALSVCLQIRILATPTPPALFMSHKWHCLCAPLHRHQWKRFLFFFAHGFNHFLITALLVVCNDIQVVVCVCVGAPRRVYFLHVCEVQSLLFSLWWRQEIRCRHQVVHVFTAPLIRLAKLF